MDGPAIESRLGGRDFLHQSTTALGPTQLPAQRVPGVKRRWCGVDQPHNLASRLKID